MNKKKRKPSFPLLSFSNNILNLFKSFKQLHRWCVFVHNNNIVSDLLNKQRKKNQLEISTLKNIPPIGKKIIIKIQISFEHTPRPLDLSNSKIAIRSRIKII